MKGLAKRLSLVICAAVVFAGCGNPWMKRITASLYDKPVMPGIPEVPGTPVLPVLTGTVSIIWTLLLEGETLTADTTLLDGSGTISYQWGQGDALTGPFTDIAFATAPDYTLQTADNGKYIVVMVTRADNSGYVTSGPGLGPVTLPALDSVAAVAMWIAADTAHGGTATNPVNLPPVNLNLASDWTNLLGVIQTAGKFVKLDLSECTMSGMEFDPDYTISTGKNRIVSLTLPDAATSVKAGTSYSDRTFQHFTSLTSVTGDYLISVGDYAFYDTALTSVSLPAVVTLGDFAFYRCTALTMVNLPVITSIGQFTFSQCDALTTVNFPVSLTSIGGAAFVSCPVLTTVEFPGLISLGGNAFNQCSALVSISLPASLTSIGWNPFEDCINLTNITVDTANPNYKAENGMLLSKDGTTLISWPAASGAVTLGTPLTTVGEYAFGGCTGLITVSLPNAASIGGWYAFRDCTALTSVNLPEVTSIDFYVFTNTGGTALTIILGNTVPTLGAGMFQLVDSAKAVTVKVPNNPAWSGKTGTFTGGDITDNWGNGFRGGGWNGSAMVDSSWINSNITLTVEYE
jgi:hypothetical protein